MEVRKKGIRILNYSKCRFNLTSVQEIVKLIAQLLNPRKQMNKQSPLLGIMPSAFESFHKAFDALAVFHC